MTGFVPATRRQLFAIYCITKKDMRNAGLSKVQASEIISKANQGDKKVVEKVAKKADKASKMQREFNTYFDTEVLPHVIDIVKRCIGIESVVKEDTAMMRGTGQNGTAKCYKMYGFGCSISYFKYRKGSKRAESVVKMFRDYDLCEKVLKAFTAKERAKYPIGALVAQDEAVNNFTHRAVCDFAKSKGIKLSYVTRLD